jgi:hypothetical protein
MTQPPNSQIPRPPDNVTWFGFWPLPASPDPEWLAIASAPDGQWIEGTVGDDIVLAIPRPCESTPAVRSEPEPVNGHEIVLYAETVNGGWTVLCDVFLDGRSMTTGEPVSVIDQRIAQAVARIPARRPILSGWRGAAIFGVFFTSIQATFVLGDSHTALGAVLGLAVILGCNVGVGRLWLMSFQFLQTREWEQPISGIARLATTAALAFATIPGLAAAFLIVGLV